ncbi:MAG: tyrosine--tRNA ligase [Candidatus Vogelbacteria bacterium]|nr:tyrosine--tRNA ligase [Candidatus Vogelbacteria bacterium]
MSLLSRGVEKLYPNETAFNERLVNGPLEIYHGIDPTGRTLHIGHLSILLKLRDLQVAGHKITILIGDFTAMIGDPTDKNATRQNLTKEEVLANCEGYKEQIGRILDLTKTKFVYNSSWLAEMTLTAFINLATEVTTGQLLERDMFVKRLATGQPIYLHEFIYPILQGYDSVVLNTDMEVGGNDQTFNMLIGRTLEKNRGKEKLVLTLKLLTDPSGKKMSKSEGNIVALNDAPDQIYGQVMSWSDEMMPLAFELCTRVAEGEIATILTDHPRDAKMRLAREIVTLIWDESAAKKAEEQFVNLFQTKGVAKELTEIEVKTGDLLMEVLVNNKIVSSKAEYRRLLESKAIKLWLADEVISDPDFKLESDLVVKVGKHRFLKIRVI